MASRQIYASSNGDTWDLMKDGSHLFVKHTPNASSGGKSSSVELAAFLGSGSGSPQNQALLELIGSLVDETPALPRSANDDQ